jgi:hypothetical protein
MELIGYYCLFCLTTTLSAMYELFWPVIKEVRITEPETMVARNWRMATFSLLIGGFVLAPILIWSVLVPKLSEKFKNRLYVSLITEQKY